MPDSRAPRTGELFRFSEAARTLRLLAEQGPRAIYEGDARAAA